MLPCLNVRKHPRANCRCLPNLLMLSQVSYISLKIMTAVFINLAHLQKKITKIEKEKGPIKYYFCVL